MAPIPRNTVDSTDNSAHDLDRLLKRLHQSVLSDEADARLLHSVYYRRKIGANVEFARTLLLRLEHDTSTIKVQSRRQSLNADLQTKRELIKQLNKRLIELDQQDDSSDDDDDSSPSSSPRADDSKHAPASQPSFAPARTDTSQGIDLNPQPPLEETSGLRSRKSGPPTSPHPDSATTSALFGSRNADPNADTTLLDRETILAQDQKTQDAISASLVGLAQALKASTIQFGQSLESGKDVLEGAAKGLDQNALGLEAAERRMGTLRRMTEGQGFLGRLKLYAIIAGLWVAAFLLVFVGPKLRF